MCLVGFPVLVLLCDDLRTGVVVINTICNLHPGSPGGVITSPRAGVAEMPTQKRVKTHDLWTSYMSHTTRYHAPPSPDAYDRSSCRHMSPRL